MGRPPPPPPAFTTSTSTGPIRRDPRHRIDRLVVMDIDLGPKASPPVVSVSTTSKPSEHRADIVV
jgi:hypothetical protein